MKDDHNTVMANLCLRKRIHISFSAMHYRSYRSDRKFQFEIILNHLSLTLFTSTLLITDPRIHPGHVKSDTSVPVTVSH